MLVLTRKRDESIMIGDDIRIIVVDVRGDQVKLGIDAPRHIPVHREEVYKEIQEENRRAALKGTPDLAALDKILRRPDGMPANDAPSTAPSVGKPGKAESGESGRKETAGQCRQEAYRHPVIVSGRILQSPLQYNFDNIRPTRRDFVPCR